MKKIVSVSIVFIVLTSTNVYAQMKAGAACDKHSSNISFGYGLVSVWKTFLDKVIEIPEYKVKSTFFYTLIYEHAIYKRFSVGISASYSRVNGKADRFELSDQITILSVLARADYHLFKSAKFDPYFGGGIGINNSKYKNLNTQTVIPDLNKSIPSTLDFSAQLGLKYFPVKHFGVYMEAGYVGGAILHVGVTSKF
ncbi:MAG: outer membrane beta-barrel protein [Ferruginibacter sp.]